MFKKKRRVGLFFSVFLVCGPIVFFFVFLFCFRISRVCVCCCTGQRLQKWEAQMTEEASRVLRDRRKIEPRRRRRFCLKRRGDIFFVLLRAFSFSPFVFRFLGICYFFRFFVDVLDFRCLRSYAFWGPGVRFVEM